MCGIFGITNFDDSLVEHARSSLNTLKHRGPDQWSDYYDEKVYLGHRRLSILDLSEQGKQPMFTQRKDVFITVNGEIYNFRELRSELEKKHTFKSRSDSEVVLHGYKEWGIEKLVEKIDGMYAFSIYDKTKRLLYLVRDRVGIKPLYFSNHQNKVVYASELKAIREFYGEEQLEIDYTSLFDFLTYLYIPAPKTMYKNVYKLEPAHYLKIDLDTHFIEDIHYWQLEVDPCEDGIEEACENIRRLVKKSVNEQMVSDVPVGFFLSGGLDSSTTVAMASELHSDISTFSIGFSTKKHDETHFADLIAERFKTNHHKKILDEETTKDLISNLKSWYDEPFADFSCFPTYLVSKYAKDNVTVVLTGDGGDEVFGGYNWYKDFAWISRFNYPLFRPLYPFLNSLRGMNQTLDKVITKTYPYTLDDFELYTRMMSGHLRDSREPFKKRWNISDDYDAHWYFKKYYREDLDLYTRLQYLDFHTYLPDDILTKVDRVSMAVSLECRVPLLSKEMIEYMFSLKPDVRLHNNQLKGAMKEAFKDVLPDEILNRKKKGFSIPIKSWEKDVLQSSGNEKEFVLEKIFNLKI